MLGKCHPVSGTLVPQIPGPSQLESNANATVLAILQLVVDLFNKHQFLLSYVRFVTVTTLNSKVDHHLSRATPVVWQGGTPTGGPALGGNGVGFAFPSIVHGVRKRLCAPIDNRNINVPFSNFFTMTHDPIRNKTMEEDRHPHQRRLVRTFHPEGSEDKGVVGSGDQEVTPTGWFKWNLFEWRGFIIFVLPRRCIPMFQARRFQSGEAMRQTGRECTLARTHVLGGDGVDVALPRVFPRICLSQLE